MYLLQEMEAIKKLMESELLAEQNGTDPVEKMSKDLAKTSLGEGDMKVNPTDGRCAAPKLPLDGVGAAQTNRGANFPSDGDIRGIPVAETNLLTLTRQKLALLQCEYDPKLCSHCKKPGAGDLKSCAKCRTAKYCSRECQSKDWGAKHKVQCKEIKRLKDVIQKEETSPTKILHAAPMGKPWPLEGNMEYFKIAFLEDKVFPLPGYDTNSSLRPFNMYSTTTGKKQGMVCQLGGKQMLTGLCAAKIGTSRYLVISNAVSEFEPWRIDFWPYPETSAQPAYTYYREPYSSGSLHLDDGKLFVANLKDQTIEEFDISSFPIKPTG